MAAGPSLLFPLVAVLLLVGFAIALTRYRRDPQAGTKAAVIALAVGVGTAGGLYAYAAYQAYVFNNTWNFEYMLDIQGNGTAPESLIVPTPQDGTLLANLRASSSSGNVNWSFVDTSLGRGLFVQFDGSATLQASVSRFPPPATSDGAGSTMLVWANCTASPSNCTGRPQLWMFYSGSAGARVVLSMPMLYLQAYPTRGWALYETLPVAVPGI